MECALGFRAEGLGVLTGRPVIHLFQLLWVVLESLGTADLAGDVWQCVCV